MTSQTAATPEDLFEDEETGVETSPLRSQTPYPRGDITTEAEDSSEDSEGSEESDDEDTPEDDPPVRPPLHTGVTEAVLETTMSSNNGKGKATRASSPAGSARSTTNQGEFNQHMRQAVMERDLQITQLQQQMQQLLAAQSGRMDTDEPSGNNPVVSGQTIGGGSFKYPTPDKFDGTSGKLKEFKSGLSAFFAFNRRTFVTEQDKVRFAATRLTGKAFEWVYPHTQDAEKPVANWKPQTVVIFTSLANFYAELDKLYGEVDEERRAVERLQNLRQLGSAAKYIAEFQHLAVQVGWQDEQLRTLFFNGLKKPVQEELDRQGKWPTMPMSEFQTEAIRIDELWYRYHGKKSAPPPRTFLPQPSQRGRVRDTRKTEPMDLSATQQPKKTNGFRGKKKGKCYNCDKEGHFARECRAPKREKQNFSATLPVVSLCAKGNLDWTEYFADSESSGTETQQADRFEKLAHDVNKDMWKKYVDQLPADQEVPSFKKWKDTMEEALRPLSEDEEIKEWEEARHKSTAMEFCKYDECPHHADEKRQLRESADKKVREDWDSHERHSQLECYKSKCRFLDPEVVAMFEDARKAPWGGEASGETQKQTEILTKDMEHMRLSWTACYDDNCTTHLSDKQGSGWFPRKPRRKAGNDVAERK